MSVSQKALNQRILYRDQFTEFARDCLKIRTKAGDLKPLTLNRAQLYIHECLEKQRAETGMVRAIILKGRQQGCSTYVEGRYYWRCIHRFGVRAFILAHKKDSTNAIYDMAKRYHAHCPEALKPNTGASNAKELVFDKLDSAFALGTAGSDDLGRGTTLQYFHGSEVAYWPTRVEASISTGILQAVADMAETEIILESTANGEGDFFHSEVLKAQRGEGDYRLIFIPWYWQDEYRRPQPIDFEPTGYEASIMEQYGLDAEQVMWRRNKVIQLSVDSLDGEKAFKQEYPNNIEEAFQTTGNDGFIPSEWFDAAIDAHLKLGFEPKGAKVVSHDPSDKGDDPKGRAYRHGSVFLNIEELKSNDVNGGCDWATDYAIAKEADYFTWDCDGLGVSLRRQISEAFAGKRIDFQEFKGSMGVDYPEKAYDEKAKGGRAKTNKQTFKNKRAQYAWKLRDKFRNTYRAIVLGEYTDPDDMISLSSDIKKLDKIRSEVCRIPLKDNDTGLIQLPSKKELAALGIASPNMFDAMFMNYGCKMSHNADEARRRVNIPSIRARRMSR